jgi:hypothetical protein
MIPHKPYQNHDQIIPHPNYPMSRGSQTAHDREIGYHDSGILQKG